MDRDIADRISYDGPLAGIALAEGGWTVLPGNGEDGDVAERYIADIVALVPDPAAPDTGTATTGTATTRTAPDAGAAVATMADRARLRIVLTPLHGVGGDTMLRAFARAGFVDVVVVAEQAAPDPDFPTVAFPNPEEPGAIDLALELAASVDADLVIANDPDADRCAVAARFPDAGWRMLRGDEVGSLLGSHVAARLVRQPAGGTAAAQPPVFANSIVSSRQLGRIAAAHGLAHATTLTGFKWISRVPGLAYGYEEALGYCVAPDLVRDKDGMSAALLVAELATALKAAGSSLPAALDDLALAHGLHATDQLSVRVPSLDLLGELMGTLRAAAPPSFAGSPVTTAADLSAGATGLPPTEGMLYLTADDTRVIVRPSGTEPKLKCYLEVIEPAHSAAALPGARARARERLDRVRADLHRILGLQPHAT
jgi:phosphomannomutase